MSLHLARCWGSLEPRFRVELDGVVIGFVFQYAGGRAWLAERRLSDAARLVLPGDFDTPEAAAEALRDPKGSPDCARASTTAKGW